VYCPLCKAEYRAGFETCSDCQVSLVAAPKQAARETRPTLSPGAGISIAKIALGVAVLALIVFASIGKDNLIKLVALVLPVLDAIFRSTFFWFCVAGAFVSWWFSWIVRDAVKDAIRELDLDERVREAVREAIEEAREEDD
jgi:hypothetical protein